MGDILNQKVKNGFKKLHIREVVETDLNDVLLTERLAFGYNKEAELMRELSHDHSASPLLWMVQALRRSRVHR